MCSKPKVSTPPPVNQTVTPPPPPPPAPPAQKAATDPYAKEGDYAAREKRKKKGRSGLRLDLSSGSATSGGTGLNVPQG